MVAILAVVELHLQAVNLKGRSLITTSIFNDKQGFWALLVDYYYCIVYSSFLSVLSSSEDFVINFRRPL